MAEVQTAIGWVQATWRHHGITVAGPQPLLVMHCTSAYPAPADSLNLRALRTMATELNLPIGYSDHSLGLEAALGAVALGAVALEKHLTLDKNLPGPDHLASSNPAEFAALVQSVRKMQAMLGDGVKQPQPIERNTRDVARRSLVLARDMKRGEVLASGDVVLRRPGTGMAPVELPQVLGRPLNRDVAAHTLLAPDMVGT